MYVHRTNNGKRISQYTCSQYSKVPVGVLCSTQHRINESAVLTLISDMLRAIAEYSRNDRAEFIKAVQETQAEQQASDITRKRKRLAAAQKRAGELEKLYEDNVLGKLPDARYAALDAQYAKEQESLSGEIAGLCCCSKAAIQDSIEAALAVTELPSLWEQYIERLSEYMESSGKGYKTTPPQSGAGRTPTKRKRNHLPVTGITA